MTVLFGTGPSFQGAAIAKALFCNISHRPSCCGCGVLPLKNLIKFKLQNHAFWHRVASVRLRLAAAAIVSGEYDCRVGEVFSLMPFVSCYFLQYILTPFVCNHNEIISRTSQPTITQFSDFSIQTAMGWINY